MGFVKILPLAIVMIAGPQILSAIFLATTDEWRRNSLAYVGGAAISITGFVSAAFLLGIGASHAGASDDALYVAVLVLLLLAALHVYLKRAESQPPKWMGKLETATPRFSFRLGFLLLGIFPTDILTSVAVGSYLVAHDDPWWHCLGFIALTLFLLALPSLLLLVLGQRAEAFLPKARDWMNTHSWVVNEIVIGFFVLLTVSDLA
jgi:threonine/homoserine/homoserine lactone efflux protein